MEPIGRKDLVEVVEHRGMCGGLFLCVVFLGLSLWHQFVRRKIFCESFECLLIPHVKQPNNPAAMQSTSTQSDTEGSYISCH